MQRDSPPAHSDGHEHTARPITKRVVPVDLRSEADGIDEEGANRLRKSLGSAVRGHWGAARVDSHCTRATEWRERGTHRTVARRNIGVDSVHWLSETGLCDYGSRGVVRRAGRSCYPVGETEDWAAVDALGWGGRNMPCSRAVARISRPAATFVRVNGDW